MCVRGDRNNSLMDQTSVYCGEIIIVGKKSYIRNTYRSGAGKLVMNDL